MTVLLADGACAMLSQAAFDDVTLAPRQMGVLFSSIKCFGIRALYINDCIIGANSDCSGRPTARAKFSASSSTRISLVVGIKSRFSNSQVTARRLPARLA